MSNMRIMWRNFFDDAVLTTDADIAGNNALANLQDASRSVWRTSGQPATVNIWGTFGGKRWAGRWFLINRHNFPAHASIRLRTYSSADWTGGTIDDLTFAPYALPGWWWGTAFQDLTAAQLLPTDFSHSGIDYFAQTSLQGSSIGSFLLTLTASSVCATQYWQAQRMYLGSYAEVPIMPEHGAIVGWQSGSTQTRLRDGTLQSEPGYLTRKFAGKMAVPNDQDSTVYFDGLNPNTYATYREELWRMLRRAELSKDLLVNVLPGFDAANSLTSGRLERDHIMACKLTTMPELAWTGATRWEMPFTLEEC